MTSAVIGSKLDILKGRKASLSDELSKLDKDIQKKRQELQRALVDGRPTEKLTDELSKLETKRQALAGAVPLIDSAVVQAGDELKRQEIEGARRELDEITQRLDARAVDIVRFIYSQWDENQASLADINRVNYLAHKYRNEVYAGEVDDSARVVRILQKSLHGMIFDLQFALPNVVKKSGVQKVNV